MSKRDRRDNDGRDRDRRDDRRDRDWDDEGQQRRAGESDIQESDSLSALKAILSKVASLLRPLNLSGDESIRLVEQLYGSVLDMDSAMAGEADDTRKSSTLAYLHNTVITREGDKVIVRFPAARSAVATGDKAPAPAGEAAAAPAAAPAEAAPPRAPRAPRPRPVARAAQGEAPAAAPSPAPEAPEAYHPPRAPPAIARKRPAALGRPVLFLRSAAWRCTPRRGARLEAAEE